MTEIILLTTAGNESSIDPAHKILSNRHRSLLEVKGKTAYAYGWAAVPPGRVYMASCFGIANVLICSQYL